MSWRGSGIRRWNFAVGTRGTDGRHLRCRRRRRPSCGVGRCQRMGNQRWLGSSSHHFGVRLQRCNFPGFSNLPLVVIPGLLSWSWSWSTSGIDNIRRAGGDVTRLGVVVVLGGGGRKGLRTRRRQRRRRRLLGSARGVSTAYDAVVLGQHLVCQSRRIGWPSSIHHKVLIQKILRCRLSISAVRCEIEMRANGANKYFRDAIVMIISVQIISHRARRRGFGLFVLALVGLERCNDATVV